MDGGRRLVPSQIGCGDLGKGGLAGDGRLKGANFRFGRADFTVYGGSQGGKPPRGDIAGEGKSSTRVSLAMGHKFWLPEFWPRLLKMPSHSHWAPGRAEVLSLPTPHGFESGIDSGD